MTEHDDSAESRIPCGDPTNCASDGDCIDYADEVCPAAEQPMTEHDDSAEHGRSKPEGPDLEVRPHAPSQVDDDSAEVERLIRVFQKPVCPMCQDDYDPDCHSCAHLGIRAVLADLRERYVLVPREGAEVEFRLQGAGTILAEEIAALIAQPGDVFESRIVGPWQVAE